MENSPQKYPWIYGYFVQCSERRRAELPADTTCSSTLINHFSPDDNRPTDLSTARPPPAAPPSTNRMRLDVAPCASSPPASAADAITAPRAESVGASAGGLVYSTYCSPPSLSPSLPLSHSLLCCCCCWSVLCRHRRCLLLIVSRRRAGGRAAGLCGRPPVRCNADAAACLR